MMQRVYLQPAGSHELSRHKKSYITAIPAHSLELCLLSVRIIHVYNDTVRGGG